MLLIGKLFEQEKIKLYHEQEGICPLCHRELDENISANHLDHDHALTGPNAGKVRALLCNLCNSVEGQIKHKFDTSGLKSKGIDIADYLEELASYYRRDISDHNIHPNYVGDMTKLFSRQDIPGMDELASQFDITFPPKLTKAKKVPLFKKGLKAFLKAKYADITRK